ncbi:biotin transporter BioY [Halorubrum sp. JWXQ-INN 858]|uniref:biotin transporter BioY n=1 Tax=Halorubrum sp. JWXQ-INN 858 TaxID=2690782 RepID=UPI00135788CC|nr:biotin transporter BioY [Halorubrum sp. JWXQ-INN 858]MWV65219.1 biotin transporter BioY [Halorubrum sp. JWXQ-INN 858]
METRTDSVDLVGDEAATNLARAALFAALVGAFAYVSFPFPLSPAPVTLQVLGVFLAGVFLGPVWGGAALVLYLLAGALGAPVFSGGSAGLGELLGPTAGYLWSYPIAAAVVGAVVHRGATLRAVDTIGVPTLVAGMAAGVVVVYTLGVFGMMAVLGLTLGEAFLQGAAVFLPAEAAKVAVAVGIVRSDAIAAA